VELPGLSGHCIEDKVPTVNVLIDKRGREAVQLLVQLLEVPVYTTQLGLLTLEQHAPNPLD
jgi:hypothetical protein